jgi:hypothetical protein
MAFLKINKVKYWGENYQYETPTLKYGVNIITGNNANGKSTFCDLIYYALGGDVEQFNSKKSRQHKIIINSDSKNFIELDIQIDEKPYSIKRYIDENKIYIEDDGIVEIYVLYRQEQGKIFSDWLLEKLGLPVVDIYQANKTYKINFKDIARLIYYNQQDPNIIFKEPDSSGFISDSIFNRTMIFQLLIGGAFSRYYDNYAKLKKAESEKNLAKGILDQQLLIARTLSENNEIENIVHLENREKEIQEQLERLKLTRDEMQKKPPSGIKSLPDLEKIKLEILSNEMAITKKEIKLKDLQIELIKFQKLRQQLIIDATSIKKIIFTHEKLKLFAPDTCPYCLSKVERKEGYCVCGSKVDETSYERFFYNTDDYSNIIKEKQKSVQTMTEAIDSCSNDIFSLQSDIDDLNHQNKDKKQRLAEIINQLDNSISVDKFNEIENKILEQREELDVVKKRKIIEIEVDRLQKDFNTKQLNYENLSNLDRTLQAQAFQELQSKIKEFNEIYNELMTNVLPECRDAKIDSETYMPIINNGTYIQHSSGVSKRLMYFFTFLKMSLRESDIKFPKFLLIDTPQASGIDKGSLLKCLQQLDNISELNNDFQIILSVGKDSYPKSWEKFVFRHLEDDDKLLKPTNE